MKRIIILLLLIFSVATVFAQVPQKNNTWWEYKLILTDTFAVPGDTVSLPSSLKPSRSFLGAKDSVLYIWSTSKQKYVPVGSGSITIDATWGNILGTLSNQTDLQTALNAKVAKTTTLTINGVAHDLSTNQSWGPFLTPADTVWLHNQITANGTDNLTFSQGLLRTGNSVVALKNDAVWNAEKLQGIAIATTLPTQNGQPLVWDSVNNRWKPGTVSGSIDLSGYVQTSRTITINGTTYDLSANRSWSVGTVTQSQLDDTAANIRADFPAAVGGTSRFGYSGEDASASENRAFYTNAYSFLIDQNDGFGSNGQLSLHDGVTFLENSYVSSPDNRNAEVKLSGYYGADITTTDYTADAIYTMHMSAAEISFESKKQSDASQLIIKYIIKNLPTYADEAAATTGGISTGQVYKTSTGELRIKL